MGIGCVSTWDQGVLWVCWAQTVTLIDHCLSPAGVVQCSLCHMMRRIRRRPEGGYLAPKLLFWDVGIGGQDGPLIRRHFILHPDSVVAELQEEARVHYKHIISGLFVIT